MGLVGRDLLWRDFKRVFDAQSSVSSDDKGYLPRIEDNLMQYSWGEDLASDLERSCSEGWRDEARAIHSPLALAINSFAFFKKRPECLFLRGRNGFAPPEFAKVLMTGYQGRLSVVDVYVWHQDETIGIASSFLEHIDAHTLKPDIRLTPSVAPWVEDCWWRVLEIAKTGGKRHLDVARLFRAYLGLRRLMTEGDQQGQKPSSATLLYLFWQSPQEIPGEVFKRHRDEIDECAALVHDSHVAFAAMAYNDLWQEWATVSALQEHTYHLAKRYRECWLDEMDNEWMDEQLRIKKAGRAKAEVVLAKGANHAFLHWQKCQATLADSVQGEHEQVLQEEDWAYEKYFVYIGHWRDLDPNSKDVEELDRETQGQNKKLMREFVARQRAQALDIEYDDMQWIYTTDKYGNESYTWIFFACGNIQLILTVEGGRHETPLGSALEHDYFKSSVPCGVGQGDACREEDATIFATTLFFPDGFSVPCEEDCTWLMLLEGRDVNRYSNLTRQPVRTPGTPLQCVHLVGLTDECRDVIRFTAKSCVAAREFELPVEDGESARIGFPPEIESTRSADVMWLYFKGKDLLLLIRLESLPGRFASQEISGRVSPRLVERDSRGWIQRVAFTDGELVNVGKESFCATFNPLNLKTNDFWEPLEVFRRHMRTEFQDRLADIGKKCGARFNRGECSVSRSERVPNRQPIATPRPVVVDPEHPTPRYRMRQFRGNWEIVFNGERASIGHEKGLLLVEYLLKNPPTEPVHVSDIEAKVCNVKTDKNGMAEIVDPETGEKITLGRNARFQERNLSIDDRECERHLWQIRKKYAAVEDDPNASENERQESSRIVGQIDEHLRKAVATRTSNAALAYDRVRQAINRLLKNLATFQDNQGNGNGVYHAFADHLQQHLIKPSSCFSCGRSSRTRAKVAQTFIYEPPDGVTWSD